jgi:hypothetical protein
MVAFIENHLESIPPTRFGPTRLAVDQTDAWKKRVLIDEFDLRSTTAELIRVMRHKFSDAHRRPVTRSTPS